MSHYNRRRTNRLSSILSRTSTSRSISGRLQKPARPTTPTSRPSKVLNKKPPRGYDKPRWDTDEAKAAQKTKLADKRERQAKYKQIKARSQARLKSRKEAARRELAEIAGQPHRDRIEANRQRVLAHKKRKREEINTKIDWKMKNSPAFKGLTHDQVRKKMGKYYSKSRYL